MVSNIWVAAADNQVKIVEEYLNSGNFTPNSKDPNGYTPIHAAASYGHIGLLQTLISRGGDINIQDSDGDTPLHHCEDVKTAKIIIEKLNGDWKIKNEEGQTALDAKEEDDEFPELIKYLKGVKYGGQIPEETEKPVETSESNATNDLISNLPIPGNVEGQNIRYSLENEEDSEISEERRKQIEAIINGENPEEALRELVTSAVHEGMSKYREEQTTDSNKRRKE